MITFFIRQCYDLEYAVTALRSIETAEKPIKNIHELLKNAIFLKQQLKYEESKRPKKESSQNSVYKRLSAHITLDIPDLTSAVRETTNRVENMMIRTNSVASGSTELQRSHTTLHQLLENVWDGWLIMCADSSPSPV